MLFKMVDVLKFLFCLCVVAIHTNVFGDLLPDVKYWITRGVFRLAVPFFFVTSGFFLGKKLIAEPENYKNIYVRYVKRLILPLSVFSVINIYLEVLRMMPDTDLLIVFFRMLKKILFYPLGALWFIWACIVGALLLYPFIKRKMFVLPLFLGFLLYCWALLCNSYYFLVQDTFLEPYVLKYISLCISARNGVFVGFVYMAIGMFLAKNHCSFVNKKIDLIFFFVVVAYIVEIYKLRELSSLDDSALLISQLLFVPFLFIYTLKTPIAISEEKCVLLRKFSIGIYLLHKPIFTVLVLLHLDDKIPNVFLWLVVSLVAGFICYAGYKQKGVLSKLLF